MNKLAIAITSMFIWGSTSGFLTIHHSRQDKLLIAGSSAHALKLRVCLSKENSSTIKYRICNKYILAYKLIKEKDVFVFSRKHFTQSTKSAVLVAPRYYSSTISTLLILSLVH